MSGGLIELCALDNCPQVNLELLLMEMLSSGGLQDDLLVVFGLKH